MRAEAFVTTHNGGSLLPIAFDTEDIDVELDRIFEQLDLDKSPVRIGSVVFATGTIDRVRVEPATDQS